jgi:hypothetical protein
MTERVLEKATTMVFEKAAIESITTAKSTTTEGGLS